MDTATGVFQILLLGPLQVRRSGGERLPALRTHKGEWLLALLTLREGRAISREWLAGMLWPNSSDGNALYNLRRCLYELREALGPDAWRLQSPNARSIALVLDGADIDLFDFDRAASAAAIPASTDIATAMDSLSQALRLYRGPLLEGCDEAWVLQERIPREASYVAALERLAFASSAASDWQSAIAYWQRVVSRDPNRESAQRSLMKAFAEQNDYAGVMQTYRALRSYLRDNLNIEPSLETQQLMLNLRAQLSTGAFVAGAGTATPNAAPFGIRSVADKQGDENSATAATRYRSIAEPPPRVAMGNESSHQESPRSSLAAETVGGAVPLDSRFYIERPVDTAFCHAVLRQDSIVLVKGPRQVGKTSLLSRGLQAAREQGRRVVTQDFQKLTMRQRESTENLYLALMQNLQERLNLEVPPDKVWNSDVGPNENFERYLRRYVLRGETANAGLVWALDEIDVLFSQPFGSEVFALFRSWHNERALDPEGPWQKLTLCISYATEAHLFITDLNQSPFNVGTRLTLEDFTPDQVAELSRRHDGLLATSSDLKRFLDLVGGHPYLVRRGLSELAGGGNGVPCDIATLEDRATLDDSPFGDHLRRMQFLLEREADLGAAMRLILANRPCPPGRIFYRLRSAGVIVGNTPEAARCRCGLYARYLETHLA